MATYNNLLFLTPSCFQLQLHTSQLESDPTRYPALAHTFTLVRRRQSHSLICNLFLHYEDSAKISKNTPLKPIGSVTLSAR